MKKMERTIHTVVSQISRDGMDRKEVCDTAVRILDRNHNINCARDDIKAGDFLIEALDLYT